MAFGSMPNDGGHLLLSDEERDELLQAEPAVAVFVRRLVGSEELINGRRRWCLWLVDASPQAIRLLRRVSERVALVRAARLRSSRRQTVALAETPTLFAEIRQPLARYLAVPEVSSEVRRYIPLAFLDADVVATNKLYTIEGASMWHFGVLQSAMHMAWTRGVCGRLESRYQYSAGIVYNNFPWPEFPTEAHRAAIESAAQAVLDTRAAFPGSTLADLYDPLAMPPALLKAHHKLDAAVDAAYGRKGFASDAERVAFLFELYQRYTSLLPAAASKRTRRAGVPRGSAARRAVSG